MAKVLIIDDDPSMSRLYQTVFTLEKHDVSIAFDGEEGIKQVQTNKPDIILLDIMMPKMNGFDVLKILKTSASYAQIPVIMLTNISNTQDLDKALKMGAIKCIVKSEQDPRQVVLQVGETLEHKTYNI